MVTQSQERLTGNDAFEGFAIDLIAEIAEILSKSNFHLDGWNENLCFFHYIASYKFHLACININLFHF